ncbi:UBP-type zinc finger domain-containing protein [Actinomadura alba]|uniref:UBP-type zinc finger domain-containing protein n=1 Tax=Actinomadura alba TaxID=406431 RepID=UPI0031E2106A
MIPDKSGDAVRLRDAGPNGSAPPCEHIADLVPVTPHATTCSECQVVGACRVGLMVCLTCGWVACSEDSPQRHAFAHYEETDHPVAGALYPQSDWRWCFVHHRAV